MTTLDEMRRTRNKAVDAKRRKRDALARLNGEPVGLMEAGPVRAHVKALVDLGWTPEGILHATGCTGTAAGLRLVTNGTSRRIERKWQPILSMPLTLGVPASVPDTCFVPTLGATRRIRALMALGWRHEDITEFIGRASHHLSSGRYPKMTAFDWRVVDAAYEKLSTAKGGSEKSQTRALRAGFAPPFAWHDIDNPTEQPRNWEHAAASRGDALRDIAAMGYGISEACRRLHVGRDALQKWCGNHGMSDVYRELSGRESQWQNQHTREAS